MVNEEYWKKRQERNILAAERSVLDYEKELTSIYQHATNEILLQLSSFFNRYGVNGKVIYNEARKNLTDKELSGFRATLDRYYKEADELGLSTEFKRYIERYSSKQRISRLESLDIATQRSVQITKHEQLKGTTNLLVDNYIHSYYYTYYNLAVSSEVPIKFDTVSDKIVRQAIRTEWAHSNYSSRIWNDGKKLVNALQQIIPQGFSMGLGVNELSSKLSHELNVSFNRSRALVRTETNHVVNQATLKSYIESGVESYKFWAELDYRTSEICRELHGKEFPVNSAQVSINYPPMHTNCRSTTLPVTSWKSTNADRTTQANRRTRITDWAKKELDVDTAKQLIAFVNKYH